MADNTVPAATARRATVVAVTVEVHVPGVVPCPFEERVVAQDNLATVAADDRPHVVDADQLVPNS